MIRHAGRGTAFKEPRPQTLCGFAAGLFAVRNFDQPKLTLENSYWAPVIVPGLVVAFRARLGSRKPSLSPLHFLRQGVPRSSEGEVFGPRLRIVDVLCLQEGRISQLAVMPRALLRRQRIPRPARCSSHFARLIPAPSPSQHLNARTVPYNPQNSQSNQEHLELAAQRSETVRSRSTHWLATECARLADTLLSGVKRLGLSS